MPQRNAPESLGFFWTAGHRESERPRPEAVPPCGAQARLECRALKETAMTPRVPIAAAIVLTTIAAVPAWAQPQPAPTPSCIDLANDPTWGLVGNPAVAGVTAVVVPATQTNAAHCQVDFTDVSLAGYAYGYPHGQTSKFRIRVGLAAERQRRRQRRHAGRLERKDPVAGQRRVRRQRQRRDGATNAGYVGTGTDTGHNASVTQSDPQSERAAGHGRGAAERERCRVRPQRRRHAELRPHHGLRVARTAPRQPVGPHRRARRTTASRTRATTSSAAPTAAARATRWRSATATSSTASSRSRRRCTGTAGASRPAGATTSPTRSWAQNGLDTAKFQDVNAARWRPATPLDGIVDGMIQETRRCKYNANAAVCGQPGASTDPAVCLSAAEAARGQQDLGRPARPQRQQAVGRLGARHRQGIFGVTPAATGAPTLFGEQINRYWVHKDPLFNWRTVSEERVRVRTAQPHAPVLAVHRFRLARPASTSSATAAR